MIYCVCGFPRAGSTLLYLMLRHSVKNCKFYDKEMSVTKVLSSKGNVCTKRPQDIFKCEELDDIQYILTIRDPRDVLTSVHTNSEGQYKTGCKYSLKTSDKGIVGKTPGLLDYYKQLSKVPNPIVVRYESLVSDPNAEQIFLETQLPELEFAKNFSDFYKSEIPSKLTHQLNGVRPPSTDNIGRWKKHPERIKQQLNECPELAEMVYELGYEDDDKWTTNL